MAYVGSTRGGPIIGDSAHSKASAIKMFTHPAPQPSNSDALLNLLISENIAMRLQSLPRLGWNALWTTLIFSSLAQAIDVDINDDQSIKNAASTAAYGAMSYYHGNESGQIPGAFPTKWWEGSALFMAMLQYQYFTGDHTYNSDVSLGLQWQAGDGDYMPSNYSSYLGNDDQMFWGLAAMLAAELQFPDRSEGYSWLSLAQGVYNTQVDRWDTSTCGGGLRWQIYTYQAGYTMKNAISNGGLFQLAARLARYTNNHTYYEWAEKVWDWSCSSPLLNNKTWSVADSTNIEDGCESQGNNQWSYNYGTYLMGAAYMWNYTNGTNSKWATAVDGLLNNTLDIFFPAKYGGNIMSEVLCEPNEVCNDNEILFKGLVTSWLAFTALLVPSTYDRILPKLQGSAVAAGATCTGNGNNSCGVRWYTSKWDGWTGMEEQISVTDVLSVSLITTKHKGPVTSTTGGNSTSNPTAGSGDKSGQTTPTRKITMGDKAGASILTIGLVVGWVSLIAFMIIGGK
ncbi:glycoside hydrolase family 76 protein [Aspergillus fumigatus Af293]|uniref:Mannan endo-1,6-alpha-mannosidase n=1 Tax=Aspergillus fumigatus (strain ATCC MYA-4609 / CBS 101355 / FGSC A1100 / Af293) TaxID=330879 RepID=Q4WFJ1_ASPFU|nr:glycosyl hydrolase, putative [Aspergillus fumigatus Af293]EAL86486.1 glycosyl hydrolase, putative [Aspergillus fumigatus Af293]